MRTKFVQFLTVLSVIGIIFSGCNKDKDDPISGPEPTVSSVSPAEGAISTELSITGVNFEDGTKVFVGGVEATVVEYSSATQLYAQVPANVEADVALGVRVLNPGGHDVLLENAFTAIAPVLQYVNSATKPSGNTGSTVIFEGKAFGSLQGASKVLFSDGAGGTIEATIASADDWTDEFIVTTVPSGAGDGPVLVETELGPGNSLEFMIADAAAFSPSAINWTVTTALPVGVSGHTSVYVPIEDATGATQRYVYVTGGKNSNNEVLNQSLYGKINADGTINAWSEAIITLEPVAFHKAIAATPFNSKVEGSGFLYLLGGVGTDGTPVSTVSRANFNEDGALGSWVAQPELPEPLHSLGVLIFKGAIYISGGSTTGDVAVDKVYKAAIDETGRLGDWEALTSLPSARSFHGFVNFGAHLYAVGGESGAVTVDDANYQSNDTKLGEIAYAKIDLRTGNITDAGWTINANPLQKSRSKHAALVVGGSLFVSSGLYAAAGQGSSENVYAQIFADGSVDTFAGATGSNTLFTAGGSNLFNMASLSYIDADGVAHAMIIGGDNVNTPGLKQNKVLFY